MRVVLVAIGSRGDVVPLAALGRRLAAAGHDVALVTHARLLPAGPWQGHPVASDPDALLAGPAAAALRRLDVRGLARTRGDFAAFLDAAGPATAAALHERRADVVVASTFAVAAVDAARRAGVPVVRAHLWPEGATLGGPAALVPYGWRLPGPARRAVRGGLRRVEPLLGGFDGGWVGGRLVVHPHHDAGFTTTDLGALHAYSPLVGQCPDEPATVATGWWRDEQGGLSPAVESLLDGDPFVHVGFGSMPQRDVPALVALVEAACTRLGVRALLQLPAATVRAGSPVVVIGDEPHGALLARVAASVHHGGSGTSGAATRAGVAQVVVPHLGDQYYWGHRLHALGVAPPPLPRPLLTAPRLADRLEQALAAAAAARTLGERVAREDGVGVAVRTLQEWAG